MHGQKNIKLFSVYISSSVWEMDFHSYLELKIQLQFRVYFCIRLGSLLDNECAWIDKASSKATQPLDNMLWKSNVNNATVIPTRQTAQWKQVPLYKHHVATWAWLSAFMPNACSKETSSSGDERKQTHAKPVFRIRNNRPRPLQKYRIKCRLFYWI